MVGVDESYVSSINVIYQVSEKSVMDSVIPCQIEKVQCQSSEAW